MNFPTNITQKEAHIQKKKNNLILKNQQYFVKLHNMDEFVLEEKKVDSSPLLE